MKTNSAWTLSLMALLAEFPSTNENEADVNLNYQYNLARAFMVRDFYLKLKEKGWEKKAAELTRSKELTAEIFNEELIPILKEVIPEEAQVKCLLNYGLKVLTYLPVPHEADAILVLTKIMESLHDSSNVLELFAHAVKTETHNSDVAKAIVAEVPEEEFVKIVLADISEEIEKTEKMEQLLETLNLAKLNGI